MEKKYRINVTTLITNLCMLISGIMAVVLAVLFFGAPAFNFEPEFLRGAMLLGSAFMMLPILIALVFNVIFKKVN